MFPRPDPVSQDEVDKLSTDQARVVQKMRRFSMVSGLVMALGIASILGVIGYRMMRGKATKAGDITATLPKGARIVSTAVADRLLVVTLDVGGTPEIRTYDLATLTPAGRLTFAVAP
ncbi:hypothetical protein DFO45_4348 [Azorhizobium sp. AG788]|uniref:hypothetical protein n=1 Tax=Azorhizobium sp. AG788 TaxID=2183897 RepID=UPI00105B2030|nr:hypothetical protein [Azorhizobium sp. AG788]TDT89431.1 hypothetical protein DFO45_4348 [Azorhizobium sp. AG788]